MTNPDYKKITACIGNNQKQQRWRDYPEWGAKLLQFHARDPRLYVGAFYEDELIGCMIAHPDQLRIKKNLLKGAVIAITEVKMEYRKQGIATQMLEKMLVQLSALEFDLVLAFQTAGRGGKNLLQQAGFHKIHKYGHAGKVLDKPTMESLMDLNPILKKIAMKFVNSDIGETRPVRGVIRQAKSEDLDQIVDLLNTESDRLDISSHWTKDYLQRKMDWRYKIFVLADGEIRGSAICYEEVSTLGKDYFTAGLFKELVFQEGVEDIEKENFIYHILSWFKEKGIPVVTYPAPKPIMKLLEKTGFRVLPGEERTVFIKSLSQTTQQLLNTIEKFRLINVFLIC
jgi:N-acetylglutamate synthase-like GNAT family acetyltransferase